ncbi:MAG: hypothetical protein PF961_19810 [Planctomycetota bacterium]|jgi:hypothetical protein|nr:hypothetical protein [Planctomycetota bacterium]
MARRTRKKRSGGLIGLVLVLLVIVGGGLFLSSIDSTPKTPEEAAFREANAKIGSHKDRVAFGNGEQSVKVAQDFTKSVRALDKVLFTGQKERSFSLTDENFLTYVQNGKNGVLFLVHVPQFKRYKNDVREALAKMCWIGAQSSCESNAIQPENLCIALRGSVFFGAIAEGRFDSSEPSIEEAAVIGDGRLHKYFAK